MSSDDRDPPIGSDPPAGPTLEVIVKRAATLEPAAARAEALRELGQALFDVKDWTPGDLAWVLADVVAAARSTS